VRIVVVDENEKFRHDFFGCDADPFCIGLPQGLFAGAVAAHQYGRIGTDKLQVTSVVETMHTLSTRIELPASIDVG
jgi:hypothetical protein